jgi:hypothetical protein
MANLVLNDKTYDLDKLPEEAKGQVVSLQFVDAEIARLNAMLAVFQTARNGYLRALLPVLESQPEINSIVQ